jgi:hypothetical protein
MKERSEQIPKYGTVRHRSFEFGQFADKVYTVPYILRPSIAVPTNILYCSSLAYVRGCIANTCCGIMWKNVFHFQWLWSEIGNLQLSWDYHYTFTGIYLLYHIPYRTCTAAYSLNILYFMLEWMPDPDTSLRVTYKRSVSGSAQCTTVLPKKLSVSATKWKWNVGSAWNAPASLKQVKIQKVQMYRIY